MEKTIIPYAQWPDSVKIMTAFYYKPAIAYFKKPVNIRNLSFVSFIIGILVILEPFLLQRAFGTPLISGMNFFLFFGGALNILLGILNLSFIYKKYLWIYEHSSWEERFTHKSSGKHQLQYVQMGAALIVISLLIAYFIQYLITLTNS